MFFLKHIIKTCMFRSPLFDCPQGLSFVLSASTTSPLVCFVQLFIRYVAVCLCACVCVTDVLVRGMSGSQPHIPRTSTSGTHVWFSTTHPTDKYIGHTCLVHNHTSHGQVHRAHMSGSHPHIPRTSISGTHLWFTTRHPTDKYIGRTHTHRQHTATYRIKQLYEANKRRCSSGTKHERRPPEDGQTVVTETCRVLIMC
jgi:hypothetical protein